jgi:hypothetical protein
VTDKLDTLYVCCPEERGLSTIHHEARAKWLPRLGPTAWCVLAELEILTADGTTTIDVAGLARAVGVKPSVLVRSLERLHRFRVAYFDPGHRLLVCDGTVPA